MRLKREPKLLHFQSITPVSYGVMFDLAKEIFSCLSREISVLTIGLFNSKEVKGYHRIEEFIDKKRFYTPAFSSSENMNFSSDPIEGLERDIGADCEIDLSFSMLDSVCDNHIQVRVRSHIMDMNLESPNHQMCDTVRHVLKALPKASGFTIPNVPWRFISSYSAKTMYSEDGFPGLSKDVYHRFSDELFWYGRLARPTELMTEHGMFRSVYPYNFLCEEQIFSLKLLFESQQFPILSASTEDRLNKRSRFISSDQKPALPGALVPIGSNAALWCVPNEKRKPAFDILKEANLTLYRFFIDHTELFSSDHTTKS